jgi:hypothetical protein
VSWDTEATYQRTLLDRRARRGELLSGVNTSAEPVAPSEVSQLTTPQGSDPKLTWEKGASELSLDQVSSALEVSQSTEESPKKPDDPGCARRWFPNASAMRIRGCIGIHVPIHALHFNTLFTSHFS